MVFVRLGAKRKFESIFPRRPRGYIPPVLLLLLLLIIIINVERLLCCLCVDKVICYHSRCHPTYVNDYHNMSKDHVNMHYLENWREDVHAFHWTFPDPPELLNRTMVERSTGMFADIGRYVLTKAGLM